MKITESKNNNRSRLVLIGMIVDSQVCGEITSRWEKEGLFQSQWENTVASWCVSYYRKYSKAPKQNIETIFSNWVDSEKADKDTVKLVSRLLENLSGSYIKTSKEMNSEFIIDIAAKLFEEISLYNLAETLKQDIEKGKVGDAQKRIKKWAPPNIGGVNGIDLLNDMEAFKRAFETKRQSLITYPGDIAKFFGDELEREGFIAFMGPEKRGKTWWLLDMAWRGLLQRRKVAFFEIGDLTEKQIIRRFGVRAARAPMKATREPLTIPKKLILEDGKPVLEDQRSKSFKEGLSWQDSWRAIEEVSKTKIRSKNPYIRLSIHPTKSLSVNGMRSIIDGWVRQDWIPDIVVVDYADILANAPGFTGDSRDAVNENWMALRRMSQELHCLVLTATQAKASAYTAEVLGMQDFSEDKRKFAHVTGMIGINQAEAEKLKGIQSLNWLVLREDEYYSSKRVYVAGCLGIANPCMCSIM